MGAGGPQIDHRLSIQEGSVEVDRTGNLIEFGGEDCLYHPDHHRHVDEDKYCWRSFY